MSDDESSDSSDDYLVSADKIDLDSEFFSQATSKAAASSRESITCISSDDSDDDFIEEEQKDSSVLLLEVMQNLEKAKNDSESFAITTKVSPKKAKQSLADEIDDLLLKSEKFDVNDEDDTHEDDHKSEETAKYTIPKEGIAITLPGTELLFNRRKKKRGIDLQAELIKKMNQRLRSSQVYIHKVGLLCWLAHGFHLNVQVNNCDVLSIAMSLVPQAKCPDGRADLKYLEQFTKWFKKIIKLEFNKEDLVITKELLLERIKKKTAHNHRELVLIYIATLRAIGLNCRLVMALCAPAMKLRRDQLFQLPDSARNDEKESKVTTEAQLSEPKETQETKAKSSKKSGKSLKKGQGNSRNKGESQDEAHGESPIKIIPENSSAGDAIAKNVAKKKAVQVFLSKFSKSPVKKPMAGSHRKSAESDDGEQSSQSSTQSSPLVSRLRSKTSKKDSDKPNSTQDSKKLPSNKSTIDLKKLSQRAAKKTTANVASTTTPIERTESDESYLGTDSDSDSSENFSPPKKQKISSKSSKSSRAQQQSNKKAERKKPEKRTSDSMAESKSKPEPSTSRQSSIDRRVLSSDEEEVIEKFDARDSRYLWVEVYVESEESWISVSVPDEKIHCVSEIFKKIPRPVLYIIGWNSSGTLKDVTRRYCPHWLTETRKQRVDEKWWKESLSPWSERQTAMSRAEDEMLLQKELEQPLPKTLSDCKGHPLYVVQRHLLKFEALYPPDCVPLGHLKTKDAIYSRHCVHTLRSRETWHKEARVVKPKAEPYKIVKAMPKWDKFTGQRMPEQPLELFGMWQTTPYIPPEVKDGVIPRNEYGNVDLFKQCMLPKGAVHIDLPGLNRIARKLQIDCAPACVGFNFGCRGALPAFEGFVVAEEHEDTLREAWEEEQIEAAKRAKEKRDKRIWGNWRKLIRGLMIRERLATKYEFKADADDGSGPSQPPAKRTKNSEKKPVKKPKTT